MFLRSKVRFHEVGLIFSIHLKCFFDVCSMLLVERRLLSSVLICEFVRIVHSLELNSTDLILFPMPYEAPENIFCAQVVLHFPLLFTTGSWYSVTSFPWLLWVINQRIRFYRPGSHNQYFETAVKVLLDVLIMLNTLRSKLFLYNTCLLQ